MLKKPLLLTALLSGLVSLGCAAVLAYVYVQDTGVPYKGRARLDYNWGYVFAPELKNEFSYEGRQFSFSYLSRYEKSSLRPFEDSGFIIGYSFDVHWSTKPPAGLIQELDGYLASGEGASWNPSPAFLKWMRVQDTGVLERVERVSLRGGAPAAILLFGARQPRLSAGVFRYLVAAHNGVLVCVETLVRSSVNEAQYAELRYGSLSGAFIEVFGIMFSPNPGRDSENAREFRHIVETFESRN